MEQIFTTLFTEAIALGWVQWMAFLTGLVYIFLITKENPKGWLWGIVSCSLWAYVTFFDFLLYADTLLQLFYVGMGIWGWYQWRCDRSENDQPTLQPATWLKPITHFYIILFGAILTLILGYFFDNYTPAAATYLDSFVTVFSVIATVLLVWRKIDNWIYWIVIDTVSIYLFASRGGYLFAILFVIYIAVSIIGFRKWRHLG